MSWTRQYGTLGEPLTAPRGWIWLGRQYFIEELKKDVMIVREEDLPRVATFRAPFEIDPPVQSTLDWWDANAKIKLTGGPYQFVTMRDCEETYREDMLLII